MIVESFKTVTFKQLLLGCFLKYKSKIYLLEKFFFLLLLAKFSKDVSTFLAYLQPVLSKTLV